MPHSKALRAIFKTPTPNFNLPHLAIGVWGKLEPSNLLNDHYWMLFDILGTPSFMQFLIALNQPQMFIQSFQFYTGPC